LRRTAHSFTEDRSEDVTGDTVDDADDKEDGDCGDGEDAGARVGKGVTADGEDEDAGGATLVVAGLAMLVVAAPNNKKLCEMIRLCTTRPQRNSFLKSYEKRSECVFMAFDRTKRVVWVLFSDGGDNHASPHRYAKYSDGRVWLLRTIQSIRQRWQ
jgi:hypothetical protein